MNGNPPKDYSSILARLSTIALYIILGTGLASIAISYIIMNSDIYPPIENKLARNILFIIGLFDMAALQFVKKSMMAKIDLTAGAEDVVYRKLLRPTLLIAGICSAISVYGLITVITGSNPQILLIFVALSLIGFQLFRIRSRDLPDKREGE